MKNYWERDGYAQVLEILVASDKSLRRKEIYNWHGEKTFKFKEPRLSQILTELKEVGLIIKDNWEYYISPKYLFDVSINMDEIWAEAKRLREKLCPIHHIKLKLIDDNVKDGDGNKYAMYRCPKCGTGNDGQIWADPKKG